jgi:hypothetical protein
MSRSSLRRQHPSYSQVLAAYSNQRSVHRVSSVSLSDGHERSFSSRTLEGYVTLLADSYISWFRKNSPACSVILRHYKEFCDPRPQRSPETYYSHRGMSDRKFRLREIFSPQLCGSKRFVKQTRQFLFFHNFIDQQLGSSFPFQLRLTCTLIPNLVLFDPLCHSLRPNTEEARQLSTSIPSCAYLPHGATQQWRRRALPRYGNPLRTRQLNNH